MNNVARQSERLFCCCQIKGEVPYEWQGEKPRAKVLLRPLGKDLYLKSKVRGLNLVGGCKYRDHQRTTTFENPAKS